MAYAGPLTPTQAAAFWKLSVLNGEDLPRLAMQWLEEGRESNAAATLAGERDATVREHGALFERCLREVGAAVPSERAAAWIYIQTLLRAIGGGYDAMDGARAVLSIDIPLFPLRNLAPGGRPYAGEERGLEQVLGLYYALADGDVPRGDMPAAKRELEAECARVLAAFYTEPPPDLEDQS